MKKLLFISLTVLLFSCKKETINNYYTNGPIIVPSNNTTTLPSNVILNLDATNSTSNENGTYWFDLSGKGNHGTLRNGARFVNGSVNFDGNDDVVTLGIIPMYNSQLTVEAWIRTTDVTPKARSIVTSNTTGDFVFYASGNGYRTLTNFGTYFNSPFNSSCYGKVDISRNGWTHYVVTYSHIAEQVRIYIDGRLNAIHNRKGVLIPQYLSIGNLASRLDEGWKGEISIVRMYNTVISESQILSNYIQEKTKFGK